MVQGYEGMFLNCDKVAHSPEIMALVGPICLEFKRRRGHPYFNWRPDSDPMRPQKQFHESQAMIRLLFGGNQCTSLDTPVMTARGMLPAAEVAVGDVLSTGAVVGRWVSPAPVKTWKLDCEGGFELVGNAEHPVMTQTGWKQLSEVEDGDRVKLVMGPPAWGVSVMDPDDAYFAGLMIGDGCVTHTSGVMSFTSGDEELRTWVTLYVERLSPVRPDSKPIEIRWCSKALKEKWVYLWGGSLDTAHTKRVPREVWKTRETCRRFLQGYTATDGCVHQGDNPKDRCVVWVSASEGLLRDVQQMLLFFGVYSTLSFNPEKEGFGGKFPQWRLRARGPAADFFMQQVGPGLQRKAAGWNVTEEAPPTERWIAVRDKSFCHDKYVVGLTVEPSNEYVTGGILSHNSGKSRTAAQEVAWWLCENHPYLDTPDHPRVYVVSATYRTVQEGIWKHLQRILPEWMVDKWGPNVPNWDIPTYVRMKNGGQVDFITAEGGADARRKLQAASVDLACIDEEVDETIWAELQARRLAGGGKVVISATLIDSEAWCCSLEDRAEDNDPTVQLFRLSTYRARDCGHVDKRIVAEMEATMSEETRMVRLEGKSRRMEGLVYPGFSKNHIIDPFAIPATWTRYCALDPGWRTFGVLWVAVSPGGQYVVYRELYEHAKHYQVIAEKIFAAEGYIYHKESGKWIRGEHTEDVAIRWIDPSAFGRHESGEYRVGTLLAQHYEINCAPAQNDVEVGIEMCARSLMPGMDDIPKMRVFNTCRNFLLEIRGYKRIEDTSSGQQSERKDGPRKKKDHLMDCWRYLEMGGLNYDSPLNPIFKQRDITTEVEGVKIALGLNERHTEDIRKILLMQLRKGEGGVNPQHVGGIGSEY